MIRKLVLVAAFFTLTACLAENSVTGRSQFIIIPPSQDAALGLEAMQEVKKTAPVVTTGAMARRVQEMGQRIARVSDRPELDWEFIVIDEPVLNAWALPGGKVAIYRKMLDNLNDEQLAAVVGHEIAHAVLRHGAEQMSRAQAQNAAILGLGVLVGTQTENQQMSQLAVSLGALASQGFVSLPHSRKMELEADHVGAIYMAKAGYDPRNAITLWQKMASLKEGGGSQPTFFSTHPSDDKRIERLRDNMPRYLEYYRG
ncbi:M48 family metallopeptidase [Kordiimonas aquimaris]|uniref:M48 family metallopeptidase n=1 Tax=Kordiimonas aquimaris TaxID=707591 RepID=UPI0021CF913D|nr:M48 family metallopeptidase [Kordiimonas aquimaris]